MKKYNYYHILVLTTFLLLLIGKVNAVNNLNIPTLSQRVTDLSQILTFNQQQQLEAHLTQLEQQRGDGSQIAIFIIPSMQGESVETYANKVFNQWRLGQAGKDNGILLLIALNDRELRIEVGYGLEGVLTDLKSHKIIQQYLVPSFKEQQYYDGILAAVNAINTVIIDPDNTFLDELDIADTIYGQLVFYVACCALATIILFSLVNLLKPTTLKRWLQIYLLMLVGVTLACYLYSQYIGYYQHIGLVKSLSFVTIMYLLLSIMVLFVFIILQLFIGVPLAEFMYKKTHLKKANTDKKVREYNVFDKSPVILTLLVLVFFCLLPPMVKFFLILFGFVWFFIFIIKSPRSGRGGRGSSGGGRSGGFSGGGGRSGGGGSSGRW